MQPQDLPFHQLCGGLALLLEAGDWARGSGIDPWQFAVKLERLRQAGLSDAHLSWLLCCEHLEHAREFTPPCDHQRSFRTVGKLNFGKRSCFMLTDTGVAWARPICRKYRPAADQRAEPHGDSAPGSSNGVPVTPHPVTPHWDRERRRLTLNGDIVLELSTRARNLLLILEAFQEEGWPPQIDDPLPAAVGVDARRRLRGVIEKLNGSVRLPCIRFSGDGSGESICWTIATRIVAQPAERGNGLRIR